MNLLIKSATLIAPENNLHRKIQDILIVDGKIAKISIHIVNEHDYQEFSRPNLHVSMGWMDASVSFGEPGYEERETLSHGLQVAALSGFTAVALNPHTHPMTENAQGVIFIKQKSADAATEVFPIGTFTLGAKGAEMSEMYDMQSHGAIAFYDYKKPITNANLLKMGLLYTRSFDGLMMSFPEEISMSYENIANESPFTLHLGFEGTPALSEVVQVNRDIEILTYTEGKLYIPTISTEGAVTKIKSARKKGLHLSCSTSAHHLTLTDKVLEDYDTNYKVNPPLRSDNDRKALIKGVKEGVITILTSDHEPLDIDQKNKEFSYAKHGTIGLESFFGAVNSVLALDDFIPCITTHPRKMFGLPVPEFEVGSMANFTFFNPETEYIFEENHILSTSKNSAFIGKKMKGEVFGIFNKNQLIVKD